MIGGCILLTAFIHFNQPSEKPDEWHHYKFCERKALNDAPAFELHPNTLCSYAAEGYLYSLQMAGKLPGAREVIQYKAICTTEI